MPSMCRSLVLVSFLVAGPLHAATPAPPQTPDSYAQPGQRVSIAPGRTLNLRCSGKGPRTVLLEAGGNADSATWFRVQPLLADKATVCAYDRAGYGFSDEGPTPRSLQADVDDLHALVTTAKLRKPLVLVGHSLGSNIVRRYAQQHPDEVAGLVLVDPPEQGADAQLPAAWKQQGEAGRAQRDAFLDACLKAAEAATLDKAEGPLASCLRAPPPWQSTVVAAATRAYKLKPPYWRTLRSELDGNTAVFAEPVPPDETYGATPIVVLTAPNDFPGVPDDVRKAMQTAREQTHTRLAASSTRAQRIAVPDTTHDIQLDQPQAVADAGAAVLEASR
ncbi:alpha/beta hydrolase [Lysobacter sp.]|uniref:alpha/beta fold hydrolase n=1 Tax=Lysobacter sp. TaxID=72226 RepID=UPI002D4801BF|nr:alpha/beta hydrolase [Lysobacter sp.]HZX78918.1 alpha/beta hydrolase [Lysobacter sp.]